MPSCYKTLDHIFIQYFYNLFLKLHIVSLLSTSISWLPYTFISSAPINLKITFTHMFLLSISNKTSSPSFKYWPTLSHDLRLNLLHFLINSFTLTFFKLRQNSNCYSIFSAIYLINHAIFSFSPITTMTVLLMSSCKVAFIVI